MTSKSHPNLFQPSPLVVNTPLNKLSVLEQNRAAGMSDLHDKKMQCRQLMAKLRNEIKSATGELKTKLISEFEALKKVSINKLIMYTLL